MNAFVQKYDVSQFLILTPSGLKHGLLLRGYVETAQKEPRRASREHKPQRTMVVPFTTIQRHLKLVSIIFQGTKDQAILDFGAVPNLLSASLIES